MVRKLRISLSLLGGACFLLPDATSAQAPAAQASAVSASAPPTQTAPTPATAVQTTVNQIKVEIPPSPNEIIAKGGKLTIDQCLEIALAKNFDILKAKENINKREGFTLEARSRKLPRLYTDGRINRRDSGLAEAVNGIEVQSQDDWGIDLKVQQSVYSGGKNSALQQQATYLEQSAKYELQSTIQQVFAKVHKEFIRVLLSRAQLKVREETTAFLAQEVESEIKQRDAGAIADFPVLRAQVELANSKSPLIRAREDLRLATEALRHLLAFEDELSQTPLLPEGELRAEPVVLSLEQALAHARVQRPELKQQALQLAAASQGVAAAEAGHLPTVDIFGGYTVEKPLYFGDFTDSQEGWSVGAQFTWNIFDGYGTKARTNQARADEMTARLTNRQQLLSIETEVRTAFASLREAEERIIASGKTVQTAEESVRLAKARLDSGSGIQLELLDSQVALTEAKTNRATALFDYSLARVQLLQAMGELASFPE